MVTVAISVRLGVYLLKEKCDGVLLAFGGVYTWVNWRQESLGNMCIKIITDQSFLTELYKKRQWLAFFEPPCTDAVSVCLKATAASRRHEV